MSTVDVHRNIAFEEAVKFDLQQKESKLMPLVTEVTNTGKMQMHDFLSEVGLFDEITGRHANTKLTEVEHKRRAITCKPFSKAFLFDDEDQARQAHNIGSIYTKDGVMAYKRSIDKLIYDGLNKPVMAGEDGTTIIPRPILDDIAVDGAYDANQVWIPNSGTDTGLTIDKLRRASNRLKVNYADDLGGFCMIVHPDQITQLLGSVEVTSADYNNVKALVRGEVDTFMGFQFIEYNGVTKSASGVYDCYAVAKGSMYLASQKSTGQLTVENSLRSDKNNAHQILMKFDKGTARMYDEGILLVQCKG